MSGFSRQQKLGYQETMQLMSGLSEILKRLDTIANMSRRRSSASEMHRMKMHTFRVEAPTA